MTNIINKTGNNYFYTFVPGKYKHSFNDSPGLKPGQYWLTPSLYSPEQICETFSICTRMLVKLDYLWKRLSFLMKQFSDS